ncbi:hypothetical protein SDJN03_17459, partial [Cucurbita argyrosperma subsp. sororia]
MLQWTIPGSPLDQSCSSSINLASNRYISSLFICSTTGNQRVGFCVLLRLSVGIEPKVEGFELMALTNFILTVAGVSAVVLLLRSDVKQSASIFRRNVKHIRQWLEEESASASKTVEKATKELESKTPHKDIPKDDKH